MGFQPSPAADDAVAIDSDDESTRWLDVSDPTGDPEATGGTITAASVVAGSVVKLYQLPDKDFHDISLFGIDSDANDFDYTYMVLAASTLPGSSFALNDYMSVGSLLIPSHRLARDRSKITVAQSLVRSKTNYLIFVINTVAQIPATNVNVRIVSFDAGDRLSG